MSKDLVLKTISDNLFFKSKKVSKIGQDQKTLISPFG